ncbi:MAG: sialidase family protein, partial [Thermoplasmata archaeon]
PGSSALPLEPAAGVVAPSLLDSGVPALPLPARTPGVGGGPLASDPSNRELDNNSATTSVAQVGPSNQTVVVGATDTTGATLVGDPEYFCCHGYSAAYRTNNGGASWTTGFVGANASWNQATSWSFGDFTLGEPSLAGGANGTVLYASIYAQPCAYYAGGVPCNSTRNLTAPAGIAVARSTNAGVSWLAPVPVDNLSWYREFAIECSDVIYSGALPANISDEPSLAYSAASGLAIVGWDVFSYDITLSCQNGVGAYSYTISYLTDVSVSKNNGATWSAPRTIGRVASLTPTVAIGPAPTYPLSVVYADYVNGTASSYDFAFSHSTDRGAVWSAPADIGPATLVHPTLGAPPDAFVPATIPVLAVDDGAGSPYLGTMYVVWGDNRTGSLPGLPSVVLSRSTSGGATWSGAVVVDAASARTKYLEPTVSVGPGGRVWLAFYELNPTSGNYQLYGQYSDDAASSWTAPFAIADAASEPGPTLASIGSWIGAAATSAGLYSAWTDCRWAGCSENSVTAAYAALTTPVTVTASAAGVYATSSADGVTTGSPAPLSTAWDNGAAVGVNVSAWVPYSNTTESVAVFSNFTGIVYSTTTSVFFDFSGGSTLRANYVAASAAWVEGTVSPASAAPTVTVGGTAVALTPWNATALAFNATVEAGLRYSVNVTGSDYRTYRTNVSTSALRASSLDVALARTAGWIRGHLLPTTATLTVNNTPVTTIAPTTGLFNVSVGWGSYWVNASGTGLDSESQYVTVLPGATTLVTINLGGGWLDGVVSPSNATVRVDGTVISVSAGTFNLTVLGGSHTVSASIPGYTGFSETVNVVPNAATTVVISLTDLGWIRGTVSPVTASVEVGGRLVPVVGGTYNVSVVGGPTYNVTASARGFTSASREVGVSPGNGSYANFTLASPPATCTTDCGTQNTTPGTAATTALPYSWLEVAIAAVVLLGVALAVAFVLLRGSGGSGPETAEDPPAPPPDEEIYGAEGSTAGTPPPGDSPPPS